MRTIKLGLIGFGNVGRGLVRILVENRAELAASHHVRFVITAVSDIWQGSLYDPEGLDAAALLETQPAEDCLAALEAPHRGWGSARIIAECNADVIVEASFTDLETGQPATEFCMSAMAAGKHVVTTNKGPAALHYRKLAETAATNGVSFGVEGAVMSGTPVLGMGLDLLAPAGVRAISGILNGTANHILTQMAAGETYEAALKQAQDLGFAEADPRGDVEGFDAAAKVAILANLFWDKDVRPQDVARTGITGLGVADMEAARAAGETWRLISYLERIGDRVSGRVEPKRLGPDHPLAAVSGANNALVFHTELLGDVTIVGPGAGRVETGYALLLDLLKI